ncbi:MAG TPA: hypothetical protein VES97_06045 [Solirubrobacteraceae bacterium]|nr:hypothetical protein [Solirubrobacteraceae bacterium]
MRRLTHKAFWGAGTTWCGLDLGPSDLPVPPEITLRMNVEHATCEECRAQYAAYVLANGAAVSP